MALPNISENLKETHSVEQKTPETKQVLPSIVSRWNHWTNYRRFWVVSVLASPPCISPNAHWCTTNIYQHLCWCSSKMALQLEHNMQPKVQYLPTPKKCLVLGWFFSQDSHIRVGSRMCKFNHHGPSCFIILHRMTWKLWNPSFMMIYWNQSDNRYAQISTGRARIKITQTLLFLNLNLGLLLNLNKSSNILKTY